MAEAAAQPQAALSLDAVRARIDAIDGELLRLIDERSGLAGAVAAAKAAAGDAGRFGLRPAREAQLLRRLLDQRHTASPTLVVRVWRELISESLSRQGPFHLTVWGGRDPVGVTELARRRFGSLPPLRQVEQPEEALAAAKTSGGVAVMPFAGDTRWWGRLLAEPKIRIFAALPCLTAWGPTSALAVGEVDIEPTGQDLTFWVTDAAGPAADVVEALGRDGVAAELMAEGGGLKLFNLAGFYMASDARLARAPGRLTGVIGAAPAPLDI